MKKYEVVFKRSNGSIGIREIQSPNLTGAINWFNDNYLYRDGELISISEVAL
jgi:hypothetical protein